MSEVLLLNNMQKVLTEYEQIIHGCMEAAKHIEELHPIAEIELELHRKAVHGMAEMQHHYGRQVVHYSNMLRIRDAQLDTYEYMSDEENYHAIASHLPADRAYLKMAEQCYKLCEECADKLIEHYEEVQEKHDKLLVHSH